MIFNRFWRREKDSSPIVFQTNARRFLANKSARIGIFTSLFLATLTLVAPLILPDDPNEQNVAIKLSAPDSRHLLGTDQYGRDVLARIADGGKRSLGAAFATLTLILFLSLFLGIVVGTIGGIVGTIGGIVDAIAMRIVDVFLALPHLVLALAIVGVLGVGFENLMLALVASSLAFYTRLVRGYTRLALNRQDIIVARLAGISRIRIVAEHVFPHVFAQILILATLDLGGIIVDIAGLSFLGLGVSPPNAEWGAMLNESRIFFTTAPWLLLAPAAAIFLSVISANLIGNALRDANDVR